MVITGSALFIKPNSYEAVLERLKEFPQVTFQVASESKTEVVVNLEEEDQGALEALCDRLKEAIPQIVDINHLYVNFEEEVGKMTGND
jgi:nitrate reductase NapAB chaperone NapD